MQSIKDLVNGPELDRLLEGITLPVNKENVIDFVEGQGANPMIVNSLRKMLPDREFRNVAEIKKALQQQADR